MNRFWIRALGVTSLLAGAAFVIGRWLKYHRSEVAYGVTDTEPAFTMSGPDLAVDHERQPGVPPASNDDYDDSQDRADADSFPASDPPGGW